MTIFSTLKTSIGNMHDSDPDDILQTRRHFKEIGIDAGEDDRPVIDKPLDNAVRLFQRELGLKEDGIMHPKGETENVLNLVLELKEKMPPLPERKGDAIAKKAGEKKADMAGTLAGGLLTRWTARISSNNKIGKVISKGGKAAEDFIASGVSEILKDPFVKSELKKEQKIREDRMKSKN